MSAMNRTTFSVRNTALMNKGLRLPVPGLADHGRVPLVVRNTALMNKGLRLSLASRILNVPVC